MNDGRYPDIDFVDTDAGKFLERMLDEYQLSTGTTLAPADPIRIFIYWITGVLVQVLALINYSAKQNLPRFAHGAYLDSLAELFNKSYRLAASASSTTMRFYISAIQESAVVVPKWTRIRTSNDLIFETSDVAVIKPGELFADVTAVCKSVGAIGNLIPVGQIKDVVDIYPYYSKAENITATEGGADTETDNAFYNRLRESLEAFSTAGSEDAYIYHAKSASQKIVDVVVLSPKPGVADIRILLENGELPDAEMINTVQAALSAKDVRPFTELVTVSTPELFPFDIELKYFIPSPRENSAAIIQDDIESAIDNYIKWQSGKMGRDINPSYLTSLLMQTGIKRVEISKPDYATMKKYAVGKIGNKSIVFGGFEDG